MITIAFTGGGTAGHIFPGLAVLAELKRLLEKENCKHRLFWIGSSLGMDRSIAEAAGIEFFGIPSGKLRRYLSIKNAVDLFRVAAGFFKAVRILKREKVSLLFSKGGFVSVPPSAAAAFLGIRLFTHESDYSPGLATKINACFVMKTNGRIFTAYKETAGYFKNNVRQFVIESGNPVRMSFRNANPAKGRAFLGVSNDARILLVLGGSQGAKEINELVKAVLPELTLIYTVVHQTGPGNLWDLPAAEKYRHYPFIKEELPDVMAAAELVMGRSGAGIWEWAVMGKPMLLIPLAGANTRGDQIENAAFFAKAGAAFALTGSDVNPESLLDGIRSIAHNNERRLEMAAASAKIGERDSALFIASHLYVTIKASLSEEKWGLR